MFALPIFVFWLLPFLFPFFWVERGRFCGIDPPLEGVLIPIEIIKGHDFRVSLFVNLPFGCSGSKLPHSVQKQPRIRQKFCWLFLVESSFLVLFIVAYLQGCWVNRLETIGNHVNHPLFYRHFYASKKGKKNSQRDHLYYLLGWAVGRKELYRKNSRQRQNRKRTNLFYFPSLSITTSTGAVTDHPSPGFLLSFSRSAVNDIFLSSSSYLHFRVCIYLPRTSVQFCF